MKYLVLDIETTGLNPFKSRLHGIAASSDEKAAQYYAADNLPRWLLDALKNENIIKVGHNVRCFDLNYLMHNIGAVINGPIYDTLLMSLCFDDSLKFHGLKELSAHYLGSRNLYKKTELDETLKKLALKHVGQLCELDLQDTSRPYLELISKYALEDHDNTWKLFQFLKTKLETQHKEIKAISPTQKTPLEYFKYEMTPIESVLLQMEKIGVSVQPTVLNEIKATCQAQLNDNLTSFYELVGDEVKKIEKGLLDAEVDKRKSAKGKAKVLANPEKYKTKFNPASGDHMAELIYDLLDCPPALVKKTKTGRSTKQEHLDLIQAAVDEDSKLAAALDLYSDIKKLNKTINTYIGDDEKGVTSLIQNYGGIYKLYPNYKQRTATGRLSVFPLQTLPRENNNKYAAKIKRLFTPSLPDNCFIYSDLSQIELRNAAHLSQDPTLMKGFNEGLDLHANTASQIFKKHIGDITKVERQVGKTCNFLLLYGGSAGRLMNELAVKNKLKFSKLECERFRRGFFDAYPQYEAYLESIKQFAETHGYVVADNGRIRHVPDIMFGKFLDHKARVFFGPENLRTQLLEDPKEKVYGEELYWRANGRYRHALNAAYNHPNQSLGATICKAAMTQLIKAGLPLVGQIHDAVIVESTKASAESNAVLVKSIMETSYKLTVPVKSDTKILTSFDEADVYEPSKEAA